MKPTDRSKKIKSAYGYRPHQSTCWSCYDGNYDKQNQEKIEGGHVYIAEYYNMFTLRSVKDQFKVGMTETDNPQKRIANIGDTEGPMKVRIVRSWKSVNPRALEQAIHSHLRSKNITGEWFNINKKELIKEVEELWQKEDSIRETYLLKRQLIRQQL